MPTLLMDFQLAPQLKKRTAAKLLREGVGKLGLFGQNVGLFGQISILSQKMMKGQDNIINFLLSDCNNPSGLSQTAFLRANLVKRVKAFTD